jgi:hypothetical protein
MAEVLLKKNILMFSWAWVVLTRTTINFINKDTMDIKYDKSVSRLIVIRSSLQQLRTELIESGRVLKRLLKKPFPCANAVCTAVEKIHDLLHREGICSVWISARVNVDDGCRFVTNRQVHAVSMLFILCLDFTEYSSA